MPSKDKKRKKKSKKPRMSAEEVLKLLKKLRPKTQQTVRVNVGTGDAKSKKDLSSYTPPFVFPGFQQQAVVTPAPPLQPPAPAPQAASFPREPVQVKTLEPESEAEPPTPRVRRTKREPPAPAASRFTAPRTTRTSQLAAFAAEPTRFSEPVGNDPYFLFAPQREESVDQIGNEPGALPSDEWTGTPSGDEQPLADFSTVGQADLPPVEAAAAAEPGPSSAVERLRTIPEISQAFGEEEAFGETASFAASPESTSAPVRLYSVEYIANLIRDAPDYAVKFLRQTIADDNFANVPQEFLTKSGRLKNKIPVGQLRDLYFNMF